LSGVGSGDFLLKYGFTEERLGEWSVWFSWHGGMSSFRRVVWGSPGCDRSPPQEWNPPHSELPLLHIVRPVKIKDAGKTLALLIVRLPGQEAPAGKGVSLYCWIGDCATGKNQRAGLEAGKSKAPPCLAKNRRDKDGAASDVPYGGHITDVPFLLGGAHWCGRSGRGFGGHFGS
jgi:hypothetical protein